MAFSAVFVDASWPCGRAKAHKPQCPEYFESNGNEKKVEINELRFNDEIRFEQNPFISIANIIVEQENIEASIKGKPVLNHNRYKVFSKLLKESRKEKANILILPEFSVPYEFVSSLSKYSDKNQLAIIAGLEHWTVAGIAYNFIVTIIPITIVSPIIKYPTFLFFMTISN